MPTCKVRKADATAKRVIFDGQSYNYTPQYSIFDADSLIDRQHRQIYPARCMSGLGVSWGVVAKSGVGYSGLNSPGNFDNRWPPLLASCSNTDIIVVLQGGQSDVTGYLPNLAPPATGAVILTRARTYATKLRNTAANYGRTMTIICTTIPPDGDGTWFPTSVTPSTGPWAGITYYPEQNRLDFNTALLAEDLLPTAGAVFDDVIDLGTIDISTSDQLHPSALGAVQMAAIVRPVLVTHL